MSKTPTPKTLNQPDEAGAGRGGVKLPTRDPCCESPCDPPWRTDDQCLIWYEQKYFIVPLRGDRKNEVAAGRAYIEFRITYEHRLCLLGKQHGPLLYTVTLLPREKVTLYHSERFRRITSAQDRFSVQTTFTQFASIIHQARVTASLDSLQERLASVKSGSSASIGGGLAGLIGLPSGSTASQTAVTDHNLLKTSVVSDQFNQSIVQASQMTHAERSVVVSTYAETDAQDITARTLENDNACRAVTYFVRKIVELYAVSTVVAEISYRIVAPNFPSDWHSANDIGWLPGAIQAEIKAILQLLPRVGDVTEQEKPISLPTDGTVYDPELAHCSSCEPEREAATEIQLRKQQAEVELLELELERRRLLVEQGELAPFEIAQAQAPEAPALPPA
jgi:thermitase